MLLKFIDFKVVLKQRFNYKIYKHYKYIDFNIHTMPFNKQQHFYGSFIVCIGIDSNEFLAQRDFMTSPITFGNKKCIRISC